VVTVVTIQADVKPPAFVACERLVVAAPLLVVVAADLFCRTDSCGRLAAIALLLRRMLYRWWVAGLVWMTAVICMW